jgi:hypothetical protein
MALDPSSRKQTVAIGYFVAAGIAMLLLQWVLAAYNTVDTIPFRAARKIAPLAEFVRV